MLSMLLNEKLQRNLRTPEVFHKKGILKNFAKFPGMQL